MVVIWIENPRVGGSIPPQATSLQRLSDSPEFLGRFSFRGTLFAAATHSRSRRD
jgi:hypothetical protein